MRRLWDCGRDGGYLLEGVSSKVVSYLRLAVVMLRLPALGGEAPSFAASVHEGCKRRTDQPFRDGNPLGWILAASLVGVIGGDRSLPV